MLPQNMLLSCNTAYRHKQVAYRIALFSKRPAFMSRAAWSNALPQEISLIHTGDESSAYYICIYNFSNY